MEVYVLTTEVTDLKEKIKEMNVEMWGQSRLLKEKDKEIKQQAGEVSAK